MIKKLYKKLKAARVGVVFCFIAGYLMIYYFMHSAPIYLPVSTTPQQANDILIILDAGHGGADGGCVSVNGVAEKGINLEILLNVKELCEAAGYNVLCTRDSDVSIHDEGITGLRNQKVSDMENRLKILNTTENAIAVSIHQNQFTDSKYSGAQMFYSATNPLSEKLATVMQRQFVSKLQPENTREIKLSGEELYLIYFTKCPSVMVECGFLSNHDEAARLETAEYQKQVAFTIFSGITEFINEI